MADIIKINETEFKPLRITLRGWAKLDELRMEMDEAISKNDFENYFTGICKFIEIASIPSEIVWDDVPWFDVLTAFLACVEKNSPTIKFPILTNAKEKNEKAPWEYKGRSWYFWLNIFAKNYGWQEEYIGNLDIDTAIGLLQEITIDEQLDKEFTYGLSEVAYPYNESTKKSVYKPLERPDWMKPIVPEPKKIKIRADMLPMGVVINVQEQREKKISGI